MRRSMKCIDAWLTDLTGPSYGLGFGVRDQNGYHFITHNGSDAGSVDANGCCSRGAAGHRGIEQCSQRPDLSTLQIGLPPSLLPNWRAGEPSGRDADVHS